MPHRSHAKKKLKSLPLLLSPLSTSSSDDSSLDENNPLSARPCCLVCSILPSLSLINTCQEHLLLIRNANRQTKRPREPLRYATKSNRPTLKENSNHSNDRSFTPRPPASSSRDRLHHHESLINARVPLQIVNVDPGERFSTPPEEISEQTEEKLDPSFSPVIFLDRITLVKDEPETL